MNGCENVTDGSVAIATAHAATKIAECKPAAANAATLTSRTVTTDRRTATLPLCHSCRADAASSFTPSTGASASSHKYSCMRCSTGLWLLLSPAQPRGHAVGVSTTTTHARAHGAARRRTYNDAAVDDHEESKEAAHGDVHRELSHSCRYHVASDTPQRPRLRLLARRQSVGTHHDQQRYPHHVCLPKENRDGAALNASDRTCTGPR
jgi:hypothetical protein